MFDSKRTMISGFWVMWFVVCMVGLIGWVMNIVKIIHTGFAVANWGGFEVARVVGVFLAPLGAVLGFM